LFKDAEEGLPVVGACSADRVAFVPLLVAEGADVKVLYIQGMIPLSLASRHGLGGEVELFIGHGADVSLQVGKRENTALLIACALNRVDVAQLLLASGVDVNHPDRDGRTPQHMAC
jgi:ankyrin repeat protein